MSKKILTAYLFLTTVSPLLSREVDVTVQLQVGNRTNKTEVRVSSKKCTQLSMDNERLGFLMRLVDEEEGETEMFETNPTYNKTLITSGFIIGKTMHIDAGANLNGHRFEKELKITILGIKKVS